MANVSFLNAFSYSFLRAHLLKVLGVQNTSHVAGLDSLQGQRSNQSCTYTTAVFGSKNLNGILLLGVRLLWPVKNFAKSLRTAGLEVRVLVEDGTIGTNMARLEILLLADSRNTTGGEARSTGANKLGKSSNKLQLGSCADNAELGVEQIGSLLQVLKGIPGVMSC